MSTPNIEELAAQLSYYSGDGDQVDMARQAQRLAANALQSQAERIAELEADFARLEATAQKFCVRNTFVEAENDTLRAELDAIAATEPVAWIDEYGNAFPLAARQYSIVGKGWKPLFTRPMPAQDVTELVEALEKLARLGNGEHYGNSDGNMIARKALSKYKGAK